MKLPKIFEHFRQGQIFTIDEAREKLQTTGNTLRKRLSELAARGYIYPIRQGLYRVSTIGENPEKAKSCPFAIASKLTPYCYVGFQSSLQLHAQEIPAAQDIVYVVSPSKFNSFSFEGRFYFWCQAPEAHGLETQFLKDGNIEFPVLVTNFEKSVVDCLKRPAHSPPFCDLLRLCKTSAHVPDLDKIIRYGTDCNVSALFNRLGFFLDCMKEFWDIPSELLLQVEQRISRKQTEWPIAFAQARKEKNQDFSNPTIDTHSNSRWKIQFTREETAESLAM
jgi:predicted transcriptional regulator of viral defense system